MGEYSIRSEPHLRWFVCKDGVVKLQEGIAVNHYKDGALVGGGGEWVDVPTVKEGEDDER